LESIIANLKSKNFWRLRIGVRSEKLIFQKAEDIVLKKFSQEEQQILKKIEPEIFETINQWIKEVAL